MVSKDEWYFSYVVSFQEISLSVFSSISNQLLILSTSTQQGLCLADFAPLEEAGEWMKVIGIQWDLYVGVKALISERTMTDELVVAISFSTKSNRARMGQQLYFLSSLWKLYCLIVTTLENWKWELCTSECRSSHLLCIMQRTTRCVEREQEQ